jgi:hypothetical protein
LASVTGRRSDPGNLRVLTVGMRRLLWLAGFLVFLAGVQLFVFSERTAELFAWTIDIPLTAAFLGAGYWASVVLEWMAAKQRAWVHARIAVPAVFVFTTLTLVATLLHIDLFHLGPGFEPVTRAATWGWIAIYVLVPPAMALLLVVQSRVRGEDPPRTAPLPSWIMGALVVQAVILLALGSYLFIVPERAASLWPWPLTPLTGRAVGAWVFSIGLAAAHSVWEKDLIRMRPAAFSYLALGSLELIALARYRDTVLWGEPQTVVYLVFLAGMLAVGAAAASAGRKHAALATVGSTDPSGERR